MIALDRLLWSNNVKDRSWPGVHFGIVGPLRF